jgi:hypothetical protein
MSTSEVRLTAARSIVHGRAFAMLLAPNALPFLHLQHCEAIVASLTNPNRDMLVRSCLSVRLRLCHYHAHTPLSPWLLLPFPAVAY